MKITVSQLANTFQGHFSDFCPFPPATDRSAYQALPVDLQAQIIQDGEAYLNYAYPALPATDFMIFRRTGNRSYFESKYFRKRHVLSTLVLAECVEYQGRFLDDIINGIFSICEESAWQIPAHNTYVRGMPQAILPDHSAPILDLFACETGALMACVAYFLGDALERFSPFLTKRIYHELDMRILQPYLNEHFWWMGRGDEPMNNWTTWCTQNTVIAAFLSPISVEKKQQILSKAAGSCDYFLKDYGDDGCCDEGAQYYRRAGLTLFQTLDIFNQITGGHFQPLFEETKIRNIAAYILNVHVHDKYYFNFADCSAVPGRCGVAEYLFGKATAQPDLSYFAAKDFQASGGLLYKDEMSQINLYTRAQTIFHHSRVMAEDTSAPIIHQDIFYSSVGLWIAHGHEFALAVKAGDNDDNHNHNDAGSFILYKNGNPVFIDIGVESYTQKTFSAERYEIWTMQSGYHNLPTIYGADQQAGANFRATQVTTQPDASHPQISMELITAYPDMPEIFAHADTPDHLSYVRRISLDKEKGIVTLLDKTNANDIVLNFITYHKPVYQGENKLLIGDCHIEFDGADYLKTETLPITDDRLREAWDHDLYRIRLRMTGPSFTLTAL